MKKIFCMFFCLIILTNLSSFTSVEASTDNTVDHVPKMVFLLSGSPSDSEDSSQIYGAELQGNWNFYGPLAFGFHGLLQKQKYGDFDTERWGLGLSLNYYLNLNSWQPYIGIKRTYYGGFGQTEEALDCLYCSDIEEDYSGGETFVTVGTSINKWTFQCDFRVSDSKSDFSEEAYDPFLVGPEYSYYFKDIPDPEFLFHIGYSW